MSLKNLRITLLSVFGFLSIYFYYIFYNFHTESKKYMLGMVAILAGAYIIYVFLSSLNIAKKSYLSVGKIVGFFLSIFALLCCYYFFIVGESFFYGLGLFLKTFFILGGISFFWYTLWAIGSKIQKFLFSQEIKNEFLGLSISLTLGSFVGFQSLFLLGLAGVLNVYGVLLMLVAFITISYKEFLSGIQRFFTYKIHNYEHDVKKESFLERYGYKRMIDELHVIMISFLLSINFISIYRPFPIGWDDLGVYMNYPKLLSEAGGLIDFGQMYMWQLYTSVGFIFGSQTYAFFLSSFSGILFAIAAYAGTRLLIPREKTPFDYGLLLVLIILMMPMTIFQLAKDMKLDYGLLFISILAVNIFYGVLQAEYRKRSKLILLILTGMCLGMAFSIKVTSLLLIVGIFSALFYYTLGILAFTVFLLLFAGVFSLGNLWPVMNIVIPEGTMLLEFGLVCIAGAVLGSVYLISRFRADFQKISVSSLCLLAGIFIALIPWVGKNIYSLSSLGKDISLMSMLSGNSISYVADYNSIYSKEELSNLKKEYSGKISESGTTDNADFGRYFGYEEGINNYLKLPWNLTFQVNQKGEFTDITYIFFAFIPLLLLFVPLRNKKYFIPIFLFTLFSLLYFIPVIPFTSIVNPLSIIGTKFFSGMMLPQGYFLIFFLTLFLGVYIAILSQENTQSRVFSSIFLFFSLYVFLWQISAYGVVWYGIVMYFLFLLLVFYAIAHFFDEQQEKRGLKYPHYFILIMVWVYIFQSSIPHGMVNLAQAKQSLHYKIGNVPEYAAIYEGHPDYAPILFHLNIAKDKRKELLGEYKKQLITVVHTSYSGQGKDIMLQSIKNAEDMSKFHNLLLQVRRMSPDFTFQKQIKAVQKNIYTKISQPGQEHQNEDKIYRLGTFLLYYISENYQRIFGDSLVTEFDTYLYDDDYDIISDRMKKLGMTSVLVDLNAATIDQDVRKGLTKRYEKVLKYFTSSSLRLVETDSVCLKIALDEYAQNKDMDKYMKLAGVNYGNDRGQKKQACLIKVLELISQNKVNANSYSYLLPYQSYIRQNETEGFQVEDYLKLLAPVIQNGYKALFEIR